MMTTHPNSVAQKRDLHVGGLGSNALGALAAVTGPARTADSWLDTARDADEYVRDHPWVAVAVAALAGLAAGYLLSRP